MHCEKKWSQNGLVPFWKGELFFSLIIMFRKLRKRNGSALWRGTKIAPQRGLSYGQANSSPRGAIWLPIFLNVADAECRYNGISHSIFRCLNVTYALFLLSYSINHSLKIHELAHVSTFFISCYNTKLQIIFTFHVKEHQSFTSQTCFTDISF